jgi:hypothetical protein
MTAVLEAVVADSNMESEELDCLEELVLLALDEVGLAAVTVTPTTDTVRRISPIAFEGRTERLNVPFRAFQRVTKRDDMLQCQ